MANQNQSGSDPNLTIPAVAAVAVVIVLSVIPFVQNFKTNDNHLNWLNHDYGKNLMVSTEQDSVFMTEGGDNQVFSTLYFMYAEKLRPDLSPYDQKGNIFKRIYGDMRYSDGQTIDRRQWLVDGAIFNGEEPFYVDYRSRNDPYFIPYWQGHRPVYLTWNSKTWNKDAPNRGIEALGDYYYKRYGIMYKIQKIQYALVDYLEIKKEISLAQAQSHLSTLLKRPVGMDYTIARVSEMTKEGFIAQNGGSLRFVKMYPSPHNVDYLDKMLIRWQDIPNVGYWDFLSREIVINYDFQMGDIYREEIRKLQELRTKESRPERLADIDKRIQDNWTNAMFYYEDSLKYGGDSLSVLHNLAVVFMKNEINSMPERSLELVRKALNLYKNSWGTYNLMLSFLIQDSLENPQNEAANIAEARKWIKQLKKYLKYYRSAQGSAEKHPLWRNFGQIEAFINEMEQTPAAQIEPLVKVVESELSSNPAGVNLQNAQTAVQVLYKRGIPFQYEPYIKRADAILKKLDAVKGNDTAFLQWGLQLSLSLQKYDQAYIYGKRMENRGGALLGDPSFYYTLGITAYYSKDVAGARNYMQKFLDMVKDNRQAQLQMREQIQQAKQFLGIQ